MATTREQARDVLAAAFPDGPMPPDARLALRAFARALGVRTPVDTVVRWLSMEGAAARAFADAYLTDARSARHAATLGRVARAARRLGHIGWTLATERRSAAPTVACEPDDPRDRAILALLRDGITQRSLVRMDVCDVAPDSPAPYVRVRVQGVREVREIRPATAAALRAWLDDRGTADGLLFTSHDPAARVRCVGPPRPMHRTAITRIVNRYASSKSASTSS